MPVDIGQHCAEIERCNQRGGRMLSIVDLIEAGTISRDLAAYSLAAIGAGASFMVGALPGGAGKTTVMGALLNFVPGGVPLAVADGDAAIRAGMVDRIPRRCYICHEIGAGDYYAYLWGEPLRRYFDLPAAGHMLATNLHADTYEQAHRQVCGENGVPESAFRRMNLMYFLSVTRTRTGLMRRIAAVWEGDGTEDHRLVYDGVGDAPAGSRLVASDTLRAAGRTVDGLLQAGVRLIGEVRSFLIAGHPPGQERMGVGDDSVSRL